MGLFVLRFPVCVISVQDAHHLLPRKRIFRMEQGREQTVNAAIIEADGGAWELKAIQNIIDYLEYALADTGVKVIG